MSFSYYFEEIKCSLDKHKILLLFSVLLFISGIICGIVIDKPLSMDLYYREYCSDMIYKIISKDYSIFLLLLSRILNYTLILVFCIFGGVIVYCIPINLIIIFYKGFIFGTACAIMISVYSLSGIIILLLVLLPQYFIFCGILSLLICSAYENAVNNKRSHCIAVQSFLKIILVAWIASVACAILEFVTVLAVIRPLNFIL